MDALEKVACCRCRASISAGEEYIYRTESLCEACCIDARSPRVRKTHWQYVRSIKGEYLVMPAADE